MVHKRIRTIDEVQRVENSHLPKVQSNPPQPPQKCPPPNPSSPQQQSHPNESLLLEAETSARARLSKTPINDLPHIAAWREAYKSFGAKPNKTRNSLEALTRRVEAGEDLDKYTGAPKLIRSTGKEPFEANSKGEKVTEFADVGEDTKRVLFILDVLDPVTEGEVRAAGEELVEPFGDDGVHFGGLLLCYPVGGVDLGFLQVLALLPHVCHDLGVVGGGAGGVVCGVDLLGCISHILVDPLSGMDGREIRGTYKQHRELKVAIVLPVLQSVSAVAAVVHVPSIRGPETGLLHRSDKFVECVLGIVDGVLERDVPVLGIRLLGAAHPAAVLDDLCQCAGLSNTRRVALDAGSTQEGWNVGIEKSRCFLEVGLVELLGTQRPAAAMQCSG
ncbi:5218_t:CDS:2 [Scutellospora calospora]|uniref:5218_t:CDS:1 n=1 Tax=Scutellospora calospora TaxID=85575 RepID=A0ACA9LHU3_9GLOM|nr:5218_t:CDS:2 [Scutellospora calospora]